MTAAIEVLKAAIEAKRREITELESVLRRLQAEAEAAFNGKGRRQRRSTGFKNGSVPQIAFEILKEVGSPMTAHALADALDKRGKVISTNVLAGSLARYMGKVFERTPDGMYMLHE